MDEERWSLCQHAPVSIFTRAVLAGSDSLVRPVANLSTSNVTCDMSISTVPSASNEPS